MLKINIVTKSTLEIKVRISNMNKKAVLMKDLKHLQNKTKKVQDLNPKYNSLPELKMR